MRSRLVVGALIERDGKILMGQKPKDTGPYPNAWHLPGGGVDTENESLADALKREIKEETNLELESIERLTFDEDWEKDRHGEMTHYIFIIFRAEARGQEKAGDDLEKLKWFDKSKLKDVALTRPSIKLFRELGWI